VAVILAKEEVKRKTFRKRKRKANVRRTESKINRERKRQKSVESVESGKFSLIDDYRRKGGIRRSTEQKSALQGYSSFPTTGGLFPFCLPI
jgi:hypothetical protein